jgi:predicted RNase H-like HicB family nuclease
MDEYHVSIEKDPDSDWLVVQCSEHPEAVSQGKTIDECIKNIKEALELVLEEKYAPSKSKLVLEVAA